jgi:hypothetical protein
VELTAASLRPTIDAVDAALPPALVSGAARARLHALAAALPFVPFVLLECHLGIEPRRVDLSAGGRTGASTRALLDAARRPWVDELNGAETVLLEYDLDAPHREPAVFAGFNAAKPPDAEALVALATALQPGATRASLDAVRRCAGAATDEVRITHLGVMTGRALQPFRVNARATSADALRRYAGAIVMHASRTAALDRLLGELERFSNRLVLAVDLAADVLPRFGVECYPGDPGADDRWPALLAHIVANGLCTPPECEALSRWAGCAPPPRTETAQAQARLAEFLGRRRSAMLVRSINHLKFVDEPGAPRRAKAYLAVNHHLHGAPP